MSHGAYEPLSLRRPSHRFGIASRSGRDFRPSGSASALPPESGRSCRPRDRSFAYRGPASRRRRRPWRGSPGWPISCWSLHASGARAAPSRSAT